MRFIDDEPQGDHIILGSVVLTDGGTALVAQVEHGKGKLIELNPGGSGNRFSDDAFELSSGRNENGEKIYGVSKAVLREYLNSHESGLVAVLPPLVVIPK